MRALALILALLAPLPALAHKVIAVVYPAGDMIEGEIGFSDGIMAAHAQVEVLDASGAPLGSAQTDAQGLFTYRPKAAVAHQFRANLGAGHIAEVALSAAEVGAIMGVAPAPEAAPVAAPRAQDADLAKILRDELRPLRQEIAAYKEKNDFQTVLGGFGYIAGIFGLGFYLAARRELKRAKSHG